MVSTNNRYQEALFESLEPLQSWIVVIVAISFSAYGLFDFNIVLDVIEMSETQQEVVYGAFGLVGLIKAYNLAHEM